MIATGELNQQNHGYMFQNYPKHTGISKSKISYLPLLHYHPIHHPFSGTTAMLGKYRFLILHIQFMYWLYPLQYDDQYGS